MLREFITLIPSAIGIAFSPVPIMAVILMLSSNRARVNSIIYVLTWIGSMLVLGAILFYVDVQTPALHHPARRPILNLFILSLGIIYLVAGVIQWVRRPRSEEQVKTPAWLNMVQKIPPYLAFVFGLTGVVFNPKNISIFLSAMATILHSHQPRRVNLAAFLFFVALASVTVVTPVAIYIFGGERSQEMLDRMHAWLRRYNQAVLAWVFIILGAVWIIDGAAKLLGV
ncbi:MAG: GAP family protein [Anaerolineales bacterium]|nr:GAP family protein [Anaerolineales bacterium]